VDASPSTSGQLTGVGLWALLPRDIHLCAASMSLVAGLFPGFVEAVVPVAHAELALLQGGTGPGLLLLHGFPQTRAAWHRIAPRLARRFAVVIPDLPGYGDSVGPAPDAHHSGYSKHATADMMLELMRALGHEQFGVAGHDQGARVAYRLALDHPSRVTSVAILDAIPTLEIAQELTYERAARLGNWFFLGQPAPLPEQVIGAAPDVYLDFVLARWAGAREALNPAAVDEYRRCFRRPSVIQAACEDYRAGLRVDVEHDRADRQSGRQIVAPTLVLWGARGLATMYGHPLTVWQRWAVHVQGQEVSCGHFLMEQAPEEVGELLEAFFTRGGA
jgi:haloacetate dehalogenase